MNAAADPAPTWPMVTLEQLPERRREALLWRYALDLDYLGVDIEVRKRSLGPCPWQPPAEARERVAALGDDGRYHLLVDDDLLCGRRRAATRRARRSPAGIRHQQWCSWRASATDREAPASTRAAGSPRRVTWTVTLTPHRTDPALVPRRQRCPISAASPHWPPPPAATRLGRIRSRLIEAFGPACQACGRNPGTVVDHDPFSTYVRGILCAPCNSLIDTCPHLAGCPWADYLNAPPAAGMRLVYPNWRKVLQHPPTLRRIELLGIDPFFALRERGEAEPTAAGDLT